MKQKIVVAESEVVSEQEWRRVRMNWNEPEHQVLTQIGRQTTIEQNCPMCGSCDTKTVYWLDWEKPVMRRELLCSECNEWHVMNEVCFETMNAAQWLELMVATGLQPVFHKTLQAMEQQNSIDLEAKQVYNQDSL